MHEALRGEGQQLNQTATAHGGATTRRLQRLHDHHLSDHQSLRRHPQLQRTNRRAIQRLVENATDTGGATSCVWHGAAHRCSSSIGSRNTLGDDSEPEDSDHKIRFLDTAGQNIAMDTPPKGRS